LQPCYAPEVIRECAGFAIDQTRALNSALHNAANNLITS